MADTYGEAGVTYGQAGGTYGDWGVAVAVAVPAGGGGELRQPLPPYRPAIKGKPRRVRRSSLTVVLVTITHRSATRSFARAATRISCSHRVRARSLSVPSTSSVPHMLIRSASCSPPSDNEQLVVLLLAATAST